MSSLDEFLNHSVIDLAIRRQWFAESIVERYGEAAASQAQVLVQDMLYACEDREGVDQNTCINLIARYMALPYNEDGGTLHLALIDKNWEREHLLFCQQYAAEQGDPVGFALANLLLSLPDDRLRQWIGKLEPDEHDSTCSAYYQPEKPCECGATPVPSHRLDTCKCGHRRGDHEGSDPQPCMYRVVNGDREDCACERFTTEQRWTL